MTVVMQLELILKYFKRAFKDFIIIHSAWVASSNYFYGWVGGWPGGWVVGQVGCLKLEIKLSQPRLKLKLS